MPPMSAQMYRPPPPPVQPQSTPVVAQPTFSQPKPAAPLPEISETQRVCRTLHSFNQYISIMILLGDVDASP
jgi:hypothetical protein